jgi:zinc transport system ATP-binding protein
MSDCCPLALAVKGVHCGRCCTKINNLTVVKGKKTIIHDINLHIHCGELTAIIGPNGGGKSTFLKAIIGELNYKGEITFLSHKEKKGRWPQVGYVPQRGDFDPGSPVSVGDLFLSRYRRKPLWLFSSQKERKKTLKCLSRVQAEHLIDRKLGELSGGEIQRVLLALAMEPVPELLLLDEPVSGVDYKGRNIFYRLVADFRKQYDLSILMVSHDIKLMRYFADRMVFLDKTILCQGTPEEVMNNNQVVQSFGNMELEQDSQLLIHN